MYCNLYLILFLKLGPYYCSWNNLATATTACMITPSLINVPSLQQITRNTVLTGFADQLYFMEDDKVFLYSGTKDSVVAKGIV